MALTLDTGHALYPYLQNLICVDDDGVIKDLKGGVTTITPDAGFDGVQASAGYGRAFRVKTTSAYAGVGIALSPAINVSTSAANTFIFIAFNWVNSGASAQGNFAAPNAFLRVNSAGTLTHQTASGGANNGPTSTGAITTSSAGSPTPQTVAMWRNGSGVGLLKMWLNGSPDAGSPFDTSSGWGSWANAGHNWNHIPNNDGGGALDADIVYIAVFNGHAPTNAEVADLHASLTGSNAFGLVTSSGTSASAPGATLTGTASLSAGAASGSTPGTAPGATLTGTASLSAGAATGQVNASAPGATLTGTASLAAGAATGAVSFTSSPLMNNTETLRFREACAWSWYPLGVVGALGGITPLEGSGTTSASTARLVITGMAAGAGILLARTADGGVYYEEGVAA